MTKIEHIISVLTGDNEQYNGFSAVDMALIFEENDYFSDLSEDDYKAIAKYVAEHQSVEIRNLRDEFVDIAQGDREFADQVSKGHVWAIAALVDNGFLCRPTIRQSLEILRIVGRGGPLKDARVNLIELIGILLNEGHFGNA